MPIPALAHPPLDAVEACIFNKYKKIQTMKASIDRLKLDPK
jgi:hypothetical protein